MHSFCKIFSKIYVVVFELEELKLIYDASIKFIDIFQLVLMDFLIYSSSIEGVIVIPLVLLLCFYLFCSIYFNTHSLVKGRIIQQERELEAHRE